LRSVALLAAVLLCGCASSKSSTPSRTQSTGVARESDMERRLDRLQLRLLEKEAQVEELQTRLDDTRDEVVRTMAKLETAASRAEAASGMAEADVALQALRSNASGQQIPEIPQVHRLVQQSNAEFNKQNFGGALYLSTQAKAIAASGRSRLAGGNRAGSVRPGETALALPIRLKVESRGNVREGPGTNYAVAFEVDRGRMLTGYSFADQWVRVSDDAGRSGWIFLSLIGRP
jgi:TolA-binding protein